MGIVVSAFLFTQLRVYGPATTVDGRVHLFFFCSKWFVRQTPIQTWTKYLQGYVDYISSFSTDSPSPCSATESQK